MRATEYDNNNIFRKLQTPRRCLRGALSLPK
jgi:hypothetical protein